MGYSSRLAVNIIFHHAFTSSVINLFITHSLLSRILGSVYRGMPRTDVELARDRAFKWAMGTHCSPSWINLSINTFDKTNTVYQDSPSHRSGTKAAAFTAVLTLGLLGVFMPTVKTVRVDLIVLIGSFEPSIQHPFHDLIHGPVTTRLQLQKGSGCLGHGV